MQIQSLATSLADKKAHPTSKGKERQRPILSTLSPSHPPDFLVPGPGAAARRRRPAQSPSEAHGEVAAVFRPVKSEYRAMQARTAALQHTHRDTIFEFRITEA